SPIVTYRPPPDVPAVIPGKKMVVHWADEAELVDRTPAAPPPFPPLPPMPVPADDVPPFPPWPPRTFAIEFDDTSRLPTPKVTTPPADPPSPPRPPLPAELAAPFPPWPPHSR